jgi:hypothetical protein
MNENILSDLTYVVVIVVYSALDIYFQIVNFAQFCHRLSTSAFHARLSETGETKSIQKILTSKQGTPHLDPKLDEKQLP